MKLIVGLGNPGEKYKNTRHNTGFMVVDQLKTGISDGQFPISNQLKIFKSDKFMNESGIFVAKTIENLKLKIENLYIVHDDLDIPLGSYKIQFGKGPKDHNGIKSVDEVLGTNEYWRVRVGIDPTSRGASRGEAIVLEDFTPEERKILDKTIKEACKKLATSLTSTN